jgi:hypothetical protein
VQAQGADRSIEFVEFRQGLQVDGLLKLVKEVCDVEERAGWSEISEEKFILTTFNDHLPEHPLAGVEELKPGLRL